MIVEHYRCKISLGGVNFSWCTLSPIINTLTGTDDIEKQMEEHLAANPTHIFVKEYRWQA